MITNKQSGYKYIFGPVPSRRLGLSLGIDLMPAKTCSLNCVYCECGKTTHLTITRDEYIPTEDIKRELKDYLNKGPRLDFVTFSGFGEPTLHSGIGEIILFLKSDYPQYRIALLTNSTLFYQDKTIKQVLAADVIIASLDAVSSPVFNKINRPHPDLKPDALIRGLVELRKEFKNQLWAEVFLLPDINTNDSELKKIKIALDRIMPDKVQLNTIDRPGTESWVKAVEKKDMTRIESYLTKAETISYGKQEQSDNKNIQNYTLQIISAIKRRPCTVEDVSRILGITVPKAQECLETLVCQKKVSKTKMPRGIFYLAKLS